MKKLNKIEVVIIGGGGHSKSIISTLSGIEGLKILGYTDKKDLGIILGVPYLGYENEIEEFPTNELIMGISYLKTPLDRKLRTSIIEQMEERGFKFPKIISKKSLVDKSSSIGNGSVILNNVFINCLSNIGVHALINNGVIIEHSCLIGNHFIASPGVIVCGDTVIGDNVFIGAGATIGDGLNICSNVIIGAGSLVLKNIESPGLYLGSPCKKVN